MRTVETEGEGEMDGATFRDASSIRVVSFGNICCLARPSDLGES